MNVFWKTSRHYVALVLLLACTSAITQELELPISPNPVGSGARAAGMASAFVAVADDATATSWNPAGLIQLERPEISIVGSFNGITEFFDADPSVVGFESTQRDQNVDLNFMSLTYPLPVSIGSRNITISLSFQKKYDLSRDFNVDFSRRIDLPANSFITETSSTSFKQDGGLSVITPALAFEVTHRLSLGIAVNLWRDSPFGESAWRSTLGGSTVVTNFDGIEIDRFETSRTEEYSHVKGQNVSIGLLWAPTPRLSLGARYDTRLDARADYFSQVTDSRLPDPTTTRERRTLTIPPVIAVGAAYRFSDRFTMSMDITTVDWDDFVVETGDGIKISLVDALPADGVTDFKRTITVRLGAEYVLIPDVLGETMNQLWTLRGGLFFDQEPASGRPPNSRAPGDGEPDDFYGGSIGVGLQLFGRVNLDAAYEVRYGADVNEDFIRGIAGFKEDVLQHRFLLSSVIYF